MSRTVLAHLNVTLADDDARTTDELTSLLSGIVEVGTPDDETAEIALTSVEEI